MPHAAPEAHEALSAHIADVRTLATVLRPIAFNHYATVSISEAGLTFTTELDRSVQANAYLPASLFNPYLFRPTRAAAAASARRGRSRSPTSSLAAPAPPSPAALAAAERSAASHLPRHAPSDSDEEDSSAEDSPPSLDFEINLSNLLECLNVFGSAPSSTKAASEGAPVEVQEPPQQGAFERGKKRKESEGTTRARVSFDDENKRLVLILEEGGAVTRCELTTMEPSGLTEMPFDADRLVGQAIMRSELLADALLSIDPTARELAIGFDPAHRSSALVARAALDGGSENASSAVRGSSSVRDNSSGRPAPAAAAAASGRGNGAPAMATLGVQMLTLRADGDFGTAEMEFPNERGVMERYACLAPCSSSYLFKYFSHALRALQTSLKTSVRLDERGLISLQCLMPRGTGATGVGGAGMGGPAAGNAARDHGFIEFAILPLDDPEPEREDSQ